VVTPESSNPRRPPEPAGDSGKQPATEPGVGRVTDESVTDETVAERRRLVALAGHVGDRPSAAGGLSDPAPSVRATALGALERIGVLEDDDLVRALADPEASVRRRAIELAIAHPAVPIRAALDDSDPSVVEVAAYTLGERGERPAVPALAALVPAESGHADPLCREAAVAALGAIGDPAGLSAVLGALEDKPAVRRRAAVALAAFEGPEVEAGLRRCLDDRDWQVRQVAEDLLSPG
jgi:HEAT repeat protein